MCASQWFAGREKINTDLTCDINYQLEIITKVNSLALS